MKMPRFDVTQHVYRVIFLVVVECSTFTDNVGIVRYRARPKLDFILDTDVSYIGQYRPIKSANRYMGGALVGYSSVFVEVTWSSSS